MLSFVLVICDHLFAVMIKRTLQILCLVSFLLFILASYASLITYVADVCSETNFLIITTKLVSLHV